MVLTSINLKGQIDTLNQSVISNSGETFESDDYILNFTMGEVVIKSYEANNKILSQGFHQPDVVITSIDQIEGFGKEIRIYPNPTSNQIKLEFKLSKSEKVVISIFDIKGKQLKTEIHSVFTELINIDIRDYPSGQYLMLIKSDDKRKQQSYKILKLK